VTLAVKGHRFSGRDLRRRSIPAFQGHRLPLTASRWDIRLLIGRRTKPTFSVFPVFSVAVTEKCCDACGDGEYYFLSGFPAGKGAGVSEALTALTACRWDIHLLIALRTKPTFWVFRVFSVAVEEKCCDVYGDGDYHLRSIRSA
jgi:hypothetical protein